MVQAPPQGIDLARAAGVYVRVLSEPQLYIEGNHRTGALIMSYILARDDRPPFVLSVENAIGYFDPSSVIKGTRKTTFALLFEVPRIKKRFAAFLQGQTGRKLLKTPRTPRYRRRRGLGPRRGRLACGRLAAVGNFQAGPLHRRRSLVLRLSHRGLVDFGDRANRAIDSAGSSPPAVTTSFSIASAAAGCSDLATSSGSVRTASSGSSRTSMNC